MNRSIGHAKALKNSRFALWKDPENLTTRQRAKLEWIAKAEPPCTAYLLKEALRPVFQLPYEEAVIALEQWIAWARRSRIERFVTLQRTIVEQKAPSLAAMEHGLSNGLIESVNTKIRLIAGMAFGFASTDALIALAMLNLAGHRPALSGRYPTDQQKSRVSGLSLGGNPADEHEPGSQPEDARTGNLAALVGGREERHRVHSPEPRLSLAHVRRRMRADFLPPRRLRIRLSRTARQP